MSTVKGKMGFFRRNYLRFSFRTNKKQDQCVTEQQAGLLRDTPPSCNGFCMYINKGKDDQMEICGYKPSKLKTAFTYLFIFLTGGLLRLVFHWIPHWMLKATCAPCSIDEAKEILITELYTGNHKVYHVKTLNVLTPECVRKLQNDDNMLNHHYIPIMDNSGSLSVHFGHGIFREMERLLMFTCKKVRYVWDPEMSEFVKLQGLDEDINSEMLHDSRGLNGGEQFMRRLVYGPNEIIVKESSVLTLLFLEVLNPFYIFQLFSFCLWFADNYYYYAAAILAMSVFGITMTVIQTRRNQRNLKSTVHSSDVVTVIRPRLKNVLDEYGDATYETEIISTEFLVPGDVIEIPAHGCILHCDAVLLTGNCILNESMLTGESVPVTKTPFPEIPNLFYNSKEHARHTLFCGTQVIQTRYFGDEKVLAVVIRTGFSTAKGGLVRSILYPPPVDFRFEKDSYRFIMLLAVIAGFGFLYTVVTKLLRGIHLSELVLEALDLITIVVPPALPAAMTVGRLYAQTRLQKNQIYCISPRTINVSGSIDCICFDKTGTLTEEGLDLLCVVPIENKKCLSAVRNVESLPYNVFVCGLVSCHSLTLINNQITGDPLDLKMFESTKWSIEEHDVSDNTKFNMIFPTVLKPPKNRPIENQTSQDGIDLQIGIIREFPFSSSSQRMGVIIRKLGAQHFEYYCKGSPEMVLSFVKKETVPDDFSEILENYTQEGYRVIALAHKELKMSYAKVQRAQRDTIESDMDLLGLIVLENRLKPETTPCIKVLNDAHIRVIMVTGDNILTALSVAKDCDIIKSGQSVISINCDNSTPPQLYYTLTNTKMKMSSTNTDYSLLSNSASIQSLETLESQTITNNILNNHIDDGNGNEYTKQPPHTLYNNYRFALSGKVWGIIRDHYPELISKVVTRGSIFARMSPDQKQQLIEELQGLGYSVAMCGDGANDCGALKAAHVGISLSEAESSVASPFTSKNPNITCVLDIIKEGRAALVTSFGIFKYMASYSLCQFVSVMILYSIDSNLTDIQFLYIDLFIISIFAFFFGRTEAYSGKLVKETPLTSLISVSPVVSLLAHLCLTVGFQVIAFLHLRMQDWFIPFDASLKEEKDSVACVENYVIFTMSSFQYIILAVVFSKGKPYRQSMFSNYGLLFSSLGLTVFSIYMALWPSSYLADAFEVVLPEDLTFRMYLLIYALVNFISAILIELVVVDYLFFKKLRFRFHNIRKSKRKYLAIEHDLQLDTKWPVLTSEYKSAASPATPIAHFIAEIVIEKENKFDKNHVLNYLYDSSTGIVDNKSGYLDDSNSNATEIPSTNNDSGSELYHSFDSSSPMTPEKDLHSGSYSLTSGDTQNISNFNSVGRDSSQSPEKKNLSDLEMNDFENR